MTLEQAFAALNKDPALTKKFVADPNGVLKGMGIDMSTVRVAKTEATGGLRKAAATGPTNCWSIGEVVCFSSGSSTLVKPAGGAGSAKK